MTPKNEIKTMNDTPHQAPVSSVIDDLERQLDAARNEKALVRVPALRRLRNVVRSYLVLTLACLPLGGVGLRQTHRQISALGPDLIPNLAFLLSAAQIWIGLTVSAFSVFAYARFLKQLRRNHVHDVSQTTALFLPLWNVIVVVSLIGIMLLMPIQSATLTPRARQWGAYIGLSVSGVVVATYFVGRHYVKSAQRELPTLVAAAGVQAPRGNYRNWRPIALALLVGSPAVLGLGYWLGDAVNLDPAATLDHQQSVNEFLANTSMEINRSLPTVLNDELRLDSTAPGPGRGMSFVLTLVNLAVADLSQSDLDQFAVTQKEQAVVDYRSNPDLARFRELHVGLSFLYRDKNGDTIATIQVSPDEL